jgi:hypothetical protein
LYLNESRTITRSSGFWRHWPSLSSSGFSGGFGDKEVRERSEMTRTQLKKLGVTFKDTAPMQGGILERKIAPVLICNKCGHYWLYPIVKEGVGGPSLPDGFWVCANGCNVGATLDDDGTEPRARKLSEQEVKNRVRLTRNKKREERERLGLCPYCGKRPPEEGRKSCESCLDRAYEFMRDARRSAREKKAAERGSAK